MLLKKKKKKKKKLQRAYFWLHRKSKSFQFHAFLINNWLYLVCKKLCSNNGGTLYFPPPPPRPLEKKERKISEVKFNFTYRPSWSGESYCDAFCWKSRWNWPLQHSQQVFAFPYAISLIRVRFKQFRKGDHLTAICIKYYLIT